MKNSISESELKEKSAGFLINFLGRQAKKYFELESSKLGLATSNIFILKHVYMNEGKSQNQITSMIKVDKALVARGVKSLEDSGFVLKKKNEKDKRIFELYLTDKGKEIIPEITKIFNNWSIILMKDFLEDEKDLLKDLLLKMCTNSKEFFEE